MKSITPTPAHPKLQELDSALLAINGSGSNGPLPSPRELALRLFARAPVDLLNRASTADLTNIVQLVRSAAKSFLDSNQPVLIESISTKENNAFIIALADRPFIVSSIAECARSLAIEISTLLHPIFTLDQRALSVCYLEVEKLSKQRQQQLSKLIAETLSQLIVVCSDFDQMLALNKQAAQNAASIEFLTKYNSPEHSESSHFMRWLADGCYIFAGCARWEIDKRGEIAKSPATTLGLFTPDTPNSKQLLEQSRADAVRLLKSSEPLAASKLLVLSPIHRRIRMSDILIKEVSVDGSVRAILSFVGMLTSRAIAQESSSVPYIRAKLTQLLELEGVVKNSHDYKYIVDLVDRMPKDEALQLDTLTLQKIVRTTLLMQNYSDARIAVRPDEAGRTVSVIVIMMRERFSDTVHQQIQEHIERALGAAPGSSEFHIDLLTYPFARFYFSVPVMARETAPIDIQRLEREIAALTSTWNDQLRAEVMESGGFEDPKEVLWRYEDGFSSEYQAAYSPKVARADILACEALSAEQNIYVTLTASGQNSFYSLTAYSLEREITISRAVPILENIGFEVLEERSSNITRRATKMPIAIHRFSVKLRESANQSLDQSVANSVAHILSDQAENDPLNHLLISAGLSLRQIGLIRALGQLLWQSGRFTGRTAIFESFTSFPQITELLNQIFYVRFDPANGLSIDQRDVEGALLNSQLSEQLRNVSDLMQDRILRGCASIIHNTVRTNYFSDTQTIAIKVASNKVDLFPQPRPYFEIFVFSPRIKGVHLRSGPVARGGIRWSDRINDFRTEVLGLAKTQRSKNAFIVPTGAKGGFIVRRPPSDPKLLPVAVEDAYREYIRALLSLADNRVGEQIVAPDGLVIHDQPDPYFVVAADKGTAKFSDVANTIATQEFNFWLGDAFASGGSHGYDHKVLGITSRGAWRCVQQHFHALGLDYDNTPFSVIGIGDMSGDVFGNGLLMSRSIKLLAAFNHAHIFVDPNPVPGSSFDERQRLFDLPRSQWTDYRRDQISAGGGVFDRNSKEIVLSPQIRAALAVPKETPNSVSGEQLVQLILKAPVDLLWNGGIGTYVKSTEESHSDVGDTTNDRVRIDADELRARVVAEGGNLGFTQRARIEFARRGGAINTDAIDNSGGVGLSDREVNIKILLSGAERSGKLDRSERDKLLADMSSEVCESVLKHNRNHSIVLTIAEYRSRRNIEYFNSFISYIGKLGYLNRALDFLPDDEDLRERAQRGQGLTRPELAVCLSASKMWTKDMLLASNLLSDPLLQKFLINYFPQRLHQRFSADILAHPLGKHIVATQVTNYIVDALGITFVHRMSISHSVEATEVLKAAFAADFLIDARAVRKEIDRCDNPKQYETFIRLRRDLAQTMREAAAWILSRHDRHTSLAELVQIYSANYQELLNSGSSLLGNSDRETYEKRLSGYQGLPISEQAQTSLALFPSIVAVLEMLWTARQTARPLSEACPVFNAIIHELALDDLLLVARRIQPSNRWEKELLSTAYEELRVGVSTLAERFISAGDRTAEKAIARIHSIPSYDSVRQAVEEARASSASVAALTVVARQLRNLHE